MKKVFAIVLIACIAFGVAFAAKSADLKVGAQLGYGAEFLSLSKDSSYVKVNNGGFYAAGTFELGLSDAFAIKAEAGINTMGKAKYTLGSSVGEVNYTAGEASPIHFSAYVGGQYALELSKDFDLLLGAGVDALIGKESSADDAAVNAAIGLGLEAAGAYNVNKNVAVTFGAKFGWHFINTDKDIDDAYGDLGDNGVSVSNVSFKVFAGLTYAL